MTDTKKCFELTSRGFGMPSPVLAGVQATGRLDGVLFELTLRQTYRNTTDRVLEVVYSFPLPHQAVVLGFATELNGQRKVGTMVARRDAERQYEQALAKGDAPVMLEALGQGLHTANIGNLQPGDEIVLETRFAQLLAFEQGRLRLAIPTTIAPRYGEAERAGLQPQQVPQVSLDAEYPLSLSVTVAGTLGSAAVECPTHRFTCAQVDGGLRLDLMPGAWLDRDVVLTVTPREPRPSLLVRGQDTVSVEAPQAVLAAFQTPPAGQRAGIALKMVVDCSGSMAGDSIASARRALHGATAHLNGNDQVSLLRFGSTSELVLAPAPCTEATLRQLAAAIDATEASLGGTEMAAALRAAFALPAGSPDGVSDVLLITDGEIWQAQMVIAAARSSGHRVFAIGVGSSPAECVLRDLAQATGGACEFATPGEALEQAARRMITRIRQVPWRDVRVDWGVRPVWEGALLASAFAGDTVMAMAGLGQSVPADAPVRLLATDANGQPIELARIEAGAPCPGDSLARIAASRRMQVADDEAAREIALKYQLMSKHTHCVLVHERAEGERSTEQAELHQVSSMLAAGWGATSSAMASGHVQFSCDVMASVSAGEAMAAALPSVWRSARTRVEALSSARMDEIEMPAFLSRRPHEPRIATLREIALIVATHMAHGGLLQGLPSAWGGLQIHGAVRAAMSRVTGLGFDEAEFWVLLAHWINARDAGARDPSIDATLQPILQALNSESVAQALEFLEAELGGWESDDWTDSRQQRLRAAMGRS